MMRQRSLSSGKVFSVAPIVVACLLAVNLPSLGRGGEMDIKKIHWLGHASFRIEVGSKQLYIDPFKLPANVPKADYIFITHSHFDHLSKEDIEKIRSPQTILVGPRDVAGQLTGMVKAVSPGETLAVGELQVIAVPAYNINKRFHPKENGWVGYVIRLPDGMRIYHAGDTDFVPEMRKVQADVALLPIGGTYTMDAKAAAEAADAIKASVTIPMHWGDIVGSQKDVEEFRKLYKGQVVVLTPER
jgi:L-ascorbate metabolism protein UlaG (beta-lactamase superfamily)